MCVCAQSLSSDQLFTTPWTIDCQIPLSVEFSGREYWSGLPFPPPGDLSNPGIKPMSLMSLDFASGLFTSAPPGNPLSVSECLVTQSCPTLRPMDCSPPGSSPWNSPDKRTVVGCLFFSRGTSRLIKSKPALLHCRQILYLLSHQESP